MTEQMRDIVDLGAGTEGQVSPSPDVEKQTGPDAHHPDQSILEDAGEAPEAAEASELSTEEGGEAIPQYELDRITQDVVKGLKTVYDPEIPVDIYELGLIYRVDLSDERLLTIDMTLTAPGCPVAGEMPGWVDGSVRNVEGISDVKVNMVFEPPWTPDRMSDEAKLELGWM